MSYPDYLSVKKLEERHPEVAENWETLETIDDLYEGGQRLYNKRKKYVHRKPDEDDHVFHFRLKMFTYDPILSENINKMLTRMSASQYVVEGITKRGEKDELWNSFRKNMDNCGMTEPDFIEGVFEKLLKYRKVYGVLDYAKEDSKVPFLALFDPRHVIHYGESGGNIEWVKIRQVVHEYSPVGENEIYLLWTIIDSEKVVRYRADLDFDLDGDLKYIGEEINLKIEQAGIEKQLQVTAYKESEVEHDWGRTPVVKCELKEGLWVTSLVCHLMKEHIRVHNNIATTAMLAGQIQRLFTPIQEGADSTVDIDEAKLQTGNEHILIGQNFQFSETQGSAIKTVGDYLSKIENRVKDLLFSSGISSGQVQPSQESGVAKSLDFVAQEQALQSYGQTIVKFYREILRMVALAIDPDQSEMVNVNGLNEFILDSLDNKVERVQKIANLSNEIPISNTAFRIIIEDLQRAMSPYASPEEIEQIMEETRQNWDSEDKPQFNLEELTNLVLDRVIDKNTARELLDLDPEMIEDKIAQEMIAEAQLQSELQQITNPQEGNQNMEITSQVIREYAENLDMAPMEVITSLQESTGLDLSALAEYMQKTSPSVDPGEQFEAQLTPDNLAIQSLVSILEDFDLGEEDLEILAEEAGDSAEFFDSLLDLGIEVTGLSQSELMAEVLQDMSSS